MKHTYDFNSNREDKKRPSTDYNGTKKYSMDEAIYLTGKGRFNILIILLSGLVLMGATIENISIAFVLPYANCDLNMTTSETGLASSIAFLGFVVSSHLWGFICDTAGRKKVIKIASTFSLIFAILSAFSVNAISIIILRFFVGIFISGLLASVFSYASEFHTRESAPKAASFVSMFMPMIFIYSSVIGLLVIPMNWSVNLIFIKFVPWRLYIILITSVNAINTLAFSFLPESPKFLLAVNKPDEALDVLRNMYEINTGNIKEGYPVYYLIPEENTNNLLATKGFVNIMKLVWKQTKPIFVPPYLDSTVKLCFIVFTLFAVGHGSVMWLPGFLIELQNNSNKTLCTVVGHESVMPSEQNCDIDNSNTTTFMIMLSIGIVFTILSALISFCLDKIRPRILVPTWIIISSIAALAINFLTHFYSIVITFITFVSSSLCAAIVSAISVSLYPTNIRAMATCFIFMFGRIGGLAGGNLIGVLLEHNCSLIFNVFAALSLICAFVFLMIKKEIPTPNTTNNCSA
ncbi:synaptic vesicle glycoprotein 2C-like isoform X1 [Contarinia nasturtii]|uniref:synaptic vesicle glycoprotein 2C-like isoform X1 n=1 Tax=Contarinia nasturtii TaxID=265458 RepID=UPI0012D48B0E|nr:synaptic vesicle glycoprotein 2C-like isoform X1 [Contarinia nasturtii]